jgi:hypothetical protein
MFQLTISYLDHWQLVPSSCNQRKSGDEAYPLPGEQQVYLSQKCDKNNIQQI